MSWYCIYMEWDCINMFALFQWRSKDIQISTINNTGNYSGGKSTILMQCYRDYMEMKIFNHKLKIEIFGIPYIDEFVCPDPWFLMACVSKWCWLTPWILIQPHLMVEKPWLVTSVETFNIPSTQLLGQFQFIYHKKIFLNTTIPLGYLWSYLGINPRYKV